VKEFRRKIYPSIGKFWKDVISLLAKREKIREMMREGQISPAFRERLMLAVTSVNQCRYCLHAHARQALVQGISEVEIQELSLGTFDQSPRDEIPALLYAQHWADSDGNVDPEARERLISTYGSQRTQAIEMSLELIQMGNLLGNTFDYLLYRISFGRWGLVNLPGASE